MDDTEKKIDSVINIALDDIMSNSFGRYAKYIIQDRALPDVRDGLKPVQRRIIYAMYNLGLTQNKPYKKSARTVGEVIGKYHPHGDSSIYEAMVRMSQDWKNNSCLVQMHGNNGSIDGDSAAAMRYTEARLSEYSESMLDSIEKDTIKFIPNFDDSEKEPSVLPTLLPNILINGATGIAAGYATNIPPYNLKEVCNFLIEYITRNKKMTINQILSVIPGPDFPTGAIIQGEEGIKSIYETGKGKIVIKSTLEEKEISKDITQLKFVDIPFDVNKSNLLKSIDEIRITNEVPGIKEVRDESDKNGVAICVEVDSSKNIDAIKAYLYKNTQLQISYNANVVVIKDRKPIQASIYDIADSYVDWSHEILIKSAKYDLKKYEDRKEIIEGLLRAMSQIDKVIDLIRKSNSKNEAIELIINFLNINEKQANAIVSLRLYNLTNFDIVKLNEEYNDLLLKIIDTKLIIDNEEHRKTIIIKTLNNFVDKYGRERKSKIEKEIEVFEFNHTDVIEVSRYTMIVTKEGYIKYITDFVNKNSDVLRLKYKESDIPIFFSSSLSTLEHLFILTSKGRCITIPVHKIKTTFARMQVGIHLNEFITLDIDEKVIFCFNATKKSLAQYKLLIATKQGMIKQIYTTEFSTYQNVKSQQYIKLKDDEVVDISFVLDDDTSVVTITKSGLINRYDISEIPTQNKNSIGVKNMKLRPNDFVVSAYPTSISNQYLFIFTNKGVKKISDFELPNSSRGNIGKMSFAQTTTQQYIIKSIPSSNNWINFLNDGSIESLIESDISLSTLSSRINATTNYDSICPIFDFSKANFINNEAIKNAEELHEE